jgi:hypothetical protein
MLLLIKFADSAAKAGFEAVCDSLLVAAAVKRVDLHFILDIVYGVFSVYAASQR